MKNEINRKDFYIDDHAVLFGLIAKHADKVLGKEGLDTCAKAVVIMARERGLRIAIRCVNNGDALDMHSYLCYAELLDTQGWNKVEIGTYAPVYQTGTIRCGWLDTWKKYGLEAYSWLYCEGIDKNVLYGFNPELRLEMDRYLAKGDQCCGFHWLDCRFTDKAELDSVMEKRAGMLSQVTKDFLYHSGHLLSTLRRTLYLEHGLERGKAVIENALKEYASLFSQEKADMICQEAEQDFLTV